MYWVVIASNRIISKSIIVIIQTYLAMSKNIPFYYHTLAVWLRFAKNLPAQAKNYIFKPTVAFEFMRSRAGYRTQTIFRL